MFKKILINYANDAFKASQKKNSKTGMDIGGFDRVIEYSPEDIDKKFYEKNRHILDKVRGAGYWLWKPYIILKTLKKKDVKDGDFIFYSDSGAYFVERIDHLLYLAKKYKQDVLVFSNVGADIEKTRTKRDVFILMKLDYKKYADTPQRGPGFILIKKSKMSIGFFEEFLKYGQDERIITDKPSCLGKNYPGFIENRHDQSIFSLLSKKYKFKAFRQPFQRPEDGGNLFLDKYPQIVVLTRKSNRDFFEKIKYQLACSHGGNDFLRRIFKIIKRSLKK